MQYITFMLVITYTNLIYFILFASYLTFHHFNYPIYPTNISYIPDFSQLYLLKLIDLKVNL